MLTTLGFNAAEKNRFSTDGFTTMEIFSLQFKLNLKSFKSYMKDLNKTFAASGVTNIRVYYNPIKLKRIIGVVHYYNQSLYVYHTIPDIDLITSTLATEYGNAYDNMIEYKDDEDKKENIELLVLSANSWTDWGDKFRLKLSQMKSKNLFSLDYIINETTRDVTHENGARTEVDALVIDDADIFNSKAVHFGPVYKKNNEAMSTLLQVSLLNTPPYNKISKFCDKRGGRVSYISLRTSYEGEEFTSRNIENTFDLLNFTSYRGELRNFNWEKYGNIHLSTHRLLTQASYNSKAGLDEDTKI